MTPGRPLTFAEGTFLDELALGLLIELAYGATNHGDAVSAEQAADCIDDL
jgi:hypothetical protein